MREKAVHRRSDEAIPVAIGGLDNPFLKPVRSFQEQLAQV
jgi:hypothetical protein